MSRADRTYRTLVNETEATLDSVEETSLPRQETEEIEPAVPEVIADRYERRELLGRGGMGEVWRVWDRRLDRTVACKVIKGVQSAHSVTRFEEEARITAQLQHPGILPVHDLGQLEDGRLWFTMKEVRGRTLGELIEAAHKDWRLGREGEWTFRRLLEGFRRVCETVAYAHARGVVHRDIKPSNVMFGDYGEVSVLDWGIAKVLGGAGVDEEPVAIAGAAGAEREGLTRAGVISGTPNYMSPEQAQGRSNEAGTPSDVYSLGASLYELLADRPPRVVKGVRKLIFQVAMGEPALRPPSFHKTGAAVDDLLDAVVMHALQVEEADRPKAADLARALSDWLDGAKKRERARELVAEAELVLVQRAELVAEAERLRVASEAALEGVEKAAPVEEKIEGWRLSDDAGRASRAANDAHYEAIHGLRSALSHAPDLPEAHATLAELFAERHRELELAKKGEEARAVELDVRQHDLDGRFTGYLRGTGALTLVTDVPAQVRLFRFVEQNRRLVPVHERDLGQTPLVSVPLEMGSYLLTLHAPGRAVVRYPVWIRRQEHWDGIAPGDSDPTVIVLPREGELAEDDCYVPAGWFWIGDDFFEHTLALRRVWADAIVAKKYPVTVGEYVSYLNDLIDTGREDEAMAAQPTVSAQGAHPFFARDASGKFTGMAHDLDGLEHFLNGPDLPVTMVTHSQCEGYSAWRAAKDLLSWRLPWEWECQHAIRGADQRRYPWGDHFDPTWCQMVFTETHPRIVPVRTRPGDVSVFGVVGGAGNVAEYSAETEGGSKLRTMHSRLLEVESSGRHVRCSSNAVSGPKTCMVAQRSLGIAGHRHVCVGFRLFYTP